MVASLAVNIIECEDENNFEHSDRNDISKQIDGEENISELWWSKQVMKETVRCG